MSRRLALALLLVFSAVLPATAAAPPFEELMPRDAAVAVIVDAPALRQGTADLPFLDLLENPAVRNLLSAVMAGAGADDDAADDDADAAAGLEAMKAEIEKTTGKTLTEILDLLSGQVAFGLVNLADSIGNEEPEFVLLAEVDGDAGDLWKTIADPRTGDDDPAPGTELRVDTEELDGVTINVWQEVAESGVTDAEGWAEVDGIAVMGQPRALLRRAVAAIRARGDDDPVSDATAFAGIQSRLAGSDILVYVNAGQIIEAMTRDMNLDEPLPDAFGLTMRGVLDALGLQALQAGYLSARLSTTPARVDYGLAYSERVGLFKAITLGKATGRPALVPADAIEASVASYDWMATYNALHDMLTAMSPMVAGMVDAQIQQLGAQMEIDLVDALLGSLGTETVSATFPPEPDEPGQTPSTDDYHQLLAITVTDRQSLEMALSALQSLAGPGVEMFDVLDYLGTPIHVAKSTLTPGTPAFAYALTDRWLLVGMGSDDPVRRALAQMHDPAPTIWDRPDVQSALSQLPPGAGGIGYQNMAALVEGWVGTMVQIHQMSADGDGTTESSDVPDTRDLEEAFGAAMSGFYQDERGLHLTILFMPPSS